jgi:hypothetical protein
MRASGRLKIVIPLVSAISLVALSAQAQDAGNVRQGGQPSGAPPQNGHAAPPQPGRGGPAQPNVGAVHPQGAPHARVNPGAGGPPQARYVARGPVPTRDFGGHPYRGHLAWEGGRWRHETHNGRYGWWWDVGGVWYFYPQPIEGPPVYISEEYVDDDVPVAYEAPPPAAYAAPAPPPPADPGASALGGALVGGVLGGLISGNATGAAAGAILGGATGAIAGATAASRPGYYWSRGDCYYRYPDGRYVPTDPRACY